MYMKEVVNSKNQPTNKKTQEFHYKLNHGDQIVNININIDAAHLNRTLSLFCAFQIKENFYKGFYFETLYTITLFLNKFSKR